MHNLKSGIHLVVGKEDENRLTTMHLNNEQFVQLSNCCSQMLSEVWPSMQQS